MKIKQLFLQNFRCFKSLKIDFDSSLTVIVGENGAGKTAILDAVAVAFGRLLTKLKMQGTTLKDSDIRIDENNKQAPFTLYGIDVMDFASQPIYWATARKRDSSDATLNELFASVSDDVKLKVKLQQIDKFANDLLDKFNRNEGYKMPLIAYYGTNRAILEEVHRRRNFKKEFSRFESLVSALNPTTRFKDAFEWFNAMEDSERREQQNRKSFEYRLPELETVRRAIETVLPGFCRPRTEIKPLRFVIDQYMDDGSIRTFRVSQLSDGYRVMLGLVMDLARRMAQANPPLAYDTGDGRNITDPLQTEAIVLIDEIDLHLHPKWQQQVLNDLQRTFENSQFIVTTHSPQVLTTLRKENIRILASDNDGSPCVRIPDNSPLAHESGDALAYIMDTHPRPEISAVLPDVHAFELLARSGKGDSDEAMQIKQRLDAAGFEFNEADLSLFEFLARKALQEKAGKA